MIFLDAEKQDGVDMIYAGQLWAPGTDRKVDYPDSDLVVDAAKKAHGKLVCLNIEHLDTWRGTLHETDISLDKLGYVADVMHETDPSLRLGYYALPSRLYWDYIKGNRAKINRIMGRFKFDVLPNGRFGPEGPADKMDVMFPSGYTMYDLERTGKWAQHAKYNTLQIKTFRTFQKQLYVFVWPRYHGSSSKGLQPIPPDLWRDYLKMLIDAKPDGLVYWDASDYFHKRNTAAYCEEQRGVFWEVAREVTAQ